MLLKSPEMKKRVNILFQSDDNFAFMVGVAMSSLLENANKDVFYDIYYFALNLSDDSRRKFNELKTRHPEVDYRLTIVDAARFEEADGLVVASPVYYASANATLIACLDRLFFSSHSASD